MKDIKTMIVTDQEGTDFILTYMDCTHLGIMEKGGYSYPDDLQNLFCYHVAQVKHRFSSTVYRHIQDWLRICSGIQSKIRDEAKTEIPKDQNPLDRKIIEALNDAVVEIGKENVYLKEHVTMLRKDVALEQSRWSAAMSKIEDLEHMIREKDNEINGLVARLCD